MATKGWGCVPLTIVAPDKDVTILILQLTIDILLHTAQSPRAAYCETDAAAHALVHTMPHSLGLAAAADGIYKLLCAPQENTETCLVLQSLQLALATMS